MIFCENLLSKHDTDQLYMTCNHCGQFLCICCADYAVNWPCHHYPVVFTGGACSGNCSRGAVFGIGGTFGEYSEWEWSVPVDEFLDSSSARTNQRAELLAAIVGVRRLGEFLLSSQSVHELRRHVPLEEMVVATDSEYVCKGVTEWMPKWKPPFLGSTLNSNYFQDKRMAN